LQQRTDTPRDAMSHGYSLLDNFQTADDFVAVCQSISIGDRLSPSEVGPIRAISSGELPISLQKLRAFPGLI